MERDVAEAAAVQSVKLDGVFGELSELSDRMVVNAERKAFRRALGALVLDAYEGLFRPIY